MDNFNAYVKKDRQEQRIAGDLHEEMQKDAYSVEQRDVYSAEDDMERIYAAYASTSFAERSKYYFVDHNMLQSKAVKYETLGSDTDTTLNDFATRHTNRSADKRKKRSREAAVKFRQAAAKEEALKKRRDNSERIPPLEAYRLQAEIMELRLEGLLKSAVAKSTDKNDEKYRGAKAKLKCYTLLFERASTLQESKDKTKILKALDKKIASAKLDMLKYGADRQATKKLELQETYRTEKTGDAIQKAAEKGDAAAYNERKKIQRDQGMAAGRLANYKSKEETNSRKVGEAIEIINPLFDDNAYEIYKKLRSQNQQIRHPEINFYFDSKKTYRKYIQDCSRMGGAMLRSVKYDEKWQPISEEDKKNHTYNMEVLEKLQTAREGNDDVAQELDEEMQKETSRFAAEGPKLIEPARIEEELIKPYREALEYNKTHPEEPKDLTQINVPFAEELLKDADALSQMSQRGLSSDAFNKVFPGVSQLLKDNDRVGGYYEAIGYINSLITVYSATKYGINVENGCNASVITRGGGAHLSRFDGGLSFDVSDGL